MKFLCICQFGHSRSVALTRVLHGYGHQAVAVGCGTSPGAIPLLAKWADVICLMDRHFIKFVPPEFHSKTTDHFHVGPDVWSNPYHQGLLDILRGRYEIPYPEWFWFQAPPVEPSIPV